MESLNFNQFQVTSHKNKDGYTVTVFDIKAGATWMEASGLSKHEATKLMRDFVKKEALSVLTLQLSDVTIKLYK
jgi:hypothetical protein